MDWPEPRRGPFRVNLRMSAFHPLRTSPLRCQKDQMNGRKCLDGRVKHKPVEEPA